MSIEATTCPYGDLNAHLNDTAMCELDDECVYSSVPWPPAEDYEPSPAAEVRSLIFFDEVQAGRKDKKT